MAKASSHMHRWFGTPVGRSMLDQEMSLIEQCRQEYKGQVMLQISASGRPLLGRSSHRRLKAVVSPNIPRKTDSELSSYSWMVSELDIMPLEDSSVDFMVLHHSLEFSDNPHAALREAVRVLAYQGHMVIICFNPHSFFGLRKSLQFVFKKAIPWAHHSLSRGRVSDWLKLMSCEPLNIAWGFYSFPFQKDWFVKQNNQIDRFFTQQGVPGGGFYVIHASKEVDGWVGANPVQSLHENLIKFPAATATRNFKETN